MKKFRIILKSGHNVGLDAVNKEEIYKKIAAGQHKFHSVIGNYIEPITPETVEKIEEMPER